MNHPFLHKRIIAGALASFGTTLQASDDWRCDAPIDAFPPPGCVYLPEPDDGLCTSFAATRNWTCLTGWIPFPPSGGDGPPNYTQSINPAAPSPSAWEPALDATQEGQRIARIALELGNIAVDASTIPLLRFRQPGEAPVRVDMLLVRDGETADVVVLASDAERSATLATLPLAGPQSTVYARWSAGRDGPRLILDSGTTRVETVLPALDVHTQLSVGGDAAARVELDPGRVSAPSSINDR